MVGHYTGPDVTSNSSSVMQLHAGSNTVFGQYTLSGGTASGSTTIAICRIPAGARITGAVLQWNNDDLQTTTSCTVTVRSRTNGNFNGDIIQATAISTKPQSFAPGYTQLGYRHTASSHAVIQLNGFAGTGTASTQFTLMLTYNCALTGD